jgi:hypothetical protein
LVERHAGSSLFFTMSPVLGCFHQAERRFYPVTFLEKMKINLQSFKQEKKSVIENEVGFNKMVRFVPHVAYNEMEKASQFRQGLKPSIRHALGAFSVGGFLYYSGAGIGCGDPTPVHHRVTEVFGC